jgi:hypothetical protein
MSRIADFVNVELAECLNTVSKTLTNHEDRIHQLLRSPQADKDDKKAYSEALVRIQRVRNGLHG